MVLLLSNLSHAPVFAGLAYCMLKTLGGRNASREHYAAAFVVTTLVAVFDEWHQSFVPGRTSSATDLLLDCAGIATMLIGVRLRHLSVRRECEAK